MKTIPWRCHRCRSSLTNSQVERQISSWAVTILFHRSESLFGYMEWRRSSSLIAVPRYDCRYKHWFYSLWLFIFNGCVFVVMCYSSGICAFCMHMASLLRCTSRSVTVFVMASSEERWVRPLLSVREYMDVLLERILHFDLNWISYQSLKEMRNSRFAMTRDNQRSIFFYSIRCWTSRRWLVPRSQWRSPIRWQECTRSRSIHRQRCAAVLLKFNQANW